MHRVKAERNGLGRVGSQVDYTRPIRKAGNLVTIGLTTSLRQVSAGNGKPSKRSRKA